MRSSRVERVLSRRSPGALFRPTPRETCGMATRIHFMGGALAIDVTESPDDVQKAITVGSRSTIQG